ncbi:chromosome partitioning protein ParB [Lachnospiraceae bacterium]|nr:chromosome partitioning protein ParB [Lachnospiraceae bacterium]
MNDSVYKSPAYQVLSVPIEKVVPNTYNPNAVAPPEMRLLYDSIKEDGYTMPIVCYYSRAQDVYVIVDGFHRYRIMLDHKDIYQRENGRLPVTVIDKPLSNRMASTIRHNRARGSHDVDLMSNIVKELHTIGRSDAWIAKHMGMSRDEILRLKQITGLTELFRDVKFGQAWKPVEEPEAQKGSEEEEEKLPEDLEESKEAGELKEAEEIK